MREPQRVADLVHDHVADARLREGLIAPNGVGLSPDEKTVYVADTWLGRLWAFDIASPGVLAEPPPFQPGRVICNLQGYQLLDSLAVEAGGKICVATIINEGLPDLIRMPHAPEKELEKAAIGSMKLREDGRLVAAQDIHLETEGAATYA